MATATRIPPTTRCPVQYSLEYTVRRDDETRAYVAYIPMLQMFTCSKSEERLKLAIHDLVENFVGICQKRGILDEVMRQRGLQKIMGEEAQRMLHAAEEFGGGQYISVENQERERAEEVVPMMFLAGRQAIAECRH